MTPRRKPPPPPAGLTAARPGAWAREWRRVRVDPKADVKPWDGQGDPVQVTPAVKSIALWASTWADYDDGAGIHPGQALLAEVTGWTGRTVGIALDAVCRLGYAWRYVDGSRSGRPASGKHAPASEYRLTVPDDAHDGRVPLFGDADPEQAG